MSTATEKTSRTVPRSEVGELVAAARKRGGYSTDRAEQIDEITSSLAALGAVEKQPILDALINRLNAERRIIRLERAFRALCSWAQKPDRDFTARLTRAEATGTKYGSRSQASVCLHAANVRTYYAGSGVNETAALEIALTLAADQAEEWAAQMEGSAATPRDSPAASPQDSPAPVPSPTRPLAKLAKPTRPAKTRGPSDASSWRNRKRAAVPEPAATMLAAPAVPAALATPSASAVPGSAAVVLASLATPSVSELVTPANAPEPAAPAISSPDEVAAAPAVSDARQETC